MSLRPPGSRTLHATLASPPAPGSTLTPSFAAPSLPRPTVHRQPYPAAGSTAHLSWRACPGPRGPNPPTHLTASGDLVGSHPRTSAQFQVQGRTKPAPDPGPWGAAEGRPSASRRLGGEHHGPALVQSLPRSTAFICLAFQDLEPMSRAIPGLG